MRRILRKRATGAGGSRIGRGERFPLKAKIKSANELREIPLISGIPLFSQLHEAGVYVNTACGGRGTCFKCRVMIENGFASISAQDRKAFSESEIRDGWRLSCQLIPRTSLGLHVPDVGGSSRKPRIQEFQKDGGLSELGRIVIDLGSTGVVVALMDKNASVEAHILNRQIRFGADVMTRLQAAQNGQLPFLQSLLVECLSLCFKELAKAHPLDWAVAAKKGVAWAAGNSAITSFFHSWPIEGLAVSPFQPVKVDSDSLRIEGLEVKTLPLLGGFIGGDALAGFVFLRDRNVPKPWILFDIGTNTEILLYTEDEKLWFTSAPAGPAFEGGNIAFGMRAESGAISHAQFISDAWKIETIGNDIPKGICGSALVDLIAQGVSAGLIAKDGFLPTGSMPIVGKIALTADDVREFQLAKSATRSGAEVLMEKSKVRPKTIYLAGTFAEHLDLSNVAEVGLLPTDIAVEVIGNSSLKGTAIFSGYSQSDRDNLMNALRNNSIQIELALEDQFQDIFVKNLGL